MTTLNDQNTSYELRQPHGGVPIKTWTRGVPVESEAIEQLSRRVAYSIDTHDVTLRGKCPSCRTAN